MSIKEQLNNLSKKFQKGGQIDTLDTTKEWWERYVNSPKYRERLGKEFPKYSESEIDSELSARKLNLDRTYPIIGGQEFQDPGLQGFARPPEEDQRRNPSIKSKIKNFVEDNIAPSSRPVHLRSGEDTSTYTHEISHSVDEGGRRIPDSTVGNLVKRVRGVEPVDIYKEDDNALYYNHVQNPNTRKALEDMNNFYPLDEMDEQQSQIYPNIKWKLGDDPQEYSPKFGYRSNPTEMIARLQSLRKDMYDQGVHDSAKEDISAETLSKYIDGIYESEEEIPPHLLDLLNESKQGNDSSPKNTVIENLQWMMNNIAKNTKKEENQMQYSQKGGTIKGELDALLQKFQNGGQTRCIPCEQKAMMQKGGRTVSQEWEDITGTPWSEARSRNVTDGSYEQNEALRKRLVSGDTSDIIDAFDPVMGTQDIEEVSILAPKSKKVRVQNEVIKKGNYDNDLPYSIIDKYDKKMYLFDQDGNYKEQSAVITGADKGDIDNAMSGSQWLGVDRNRGKNFNDYTTYLADTKQRITPSGIFTVEKNRKDVLDNPSTKWKYGLPAIEHLSKAIPYVGPIISGFAKHRQEEILQNRQKSYGDGRMLTLADEDGVASSKAIHTTGYADRNEKLNAGQGGNMSAGCINVPGKGNSCFETLSDGSKVFILPENGNNPLKPQNKKETVIDYKSKVVDDKKIKGITQMAAAKRKYRDLLDEAGVAYSKYELDFLSSVAAKETRGGNSFEAKYIEPLFAGVGSKNLDDKTGIPFGAKSLGDFQINPQTFAEYLPEDYSYNNTVSQAKAILNFYRKNSIGKRLSRTGTSASGEDKNIIDPTDARQLYNLFNTGSKNKTGPQIDKFMSIYRTISKQK